MALAGGVLGGAAFELTGVGSFMDGFIVGALAGGSAGWNTWSKTPQGINAKHARTVASSNPCVGQYTQGATILAVLIVLVYIAYKFSNSMGNFFDFDLFPKKDSGTSNQGAPSACGGVSSV